MNSHVQIPKSILRNHSYQYKNRGDVVDYLNLKNNRIYKRKRIRELGAIEGYYSDEFKKYLSDNIETPFGEISKRIREFSNNKVQNLSFGEKESKIVLEFFNNIFLRSELTLKTTNQYSSSAIINPFSHEELLRLSRQNFFKENWINIIINKIDKRFVIPRNCFYAKKSNTHNKFHYILPFTPQVAIILLPKEEISEYETEKGKIDYLYIDDEKTIENMNELALSIELNTNNKFIVGEVNELKRLRKINRKYLRKAKIKKTKRGIQGIVSKILKQ
jgi:hypothetical protein